MQRTVSRADRICNGYDLEIPQVVDDNLIVPPESLQGAIRHAPMRRNHDQVNNCVPETPAPVYMLLHIVQVSQILRLSL